jgi:hypothetical protein
MQGVHQPAGQEPGGGEIGRGRAAQQRHAPLRRERLGDGLLRHPLGAHQPLPQPPLSRRPLRGKRPRQLLARDRPAGQQQQAQRNAVTVDGLLQAGPGQLTAEGGADQGIQALAAANGATLEPEGRQRRPRVAGTPRPRADGGTRQRPGQAAAAFAPAPSADIALRRTLRSARESRSPALDRACPGGALPAEDLS